MAVTTRSKTRSRKANRKIYRQRTRRSHCRKLMRPRCRRTSGCKYTVGPRRYFCRKSKNQKI